MSFIIYSSHPSFTHVIFFQLSVRVNLDWAISVSDIEHAEMLAFCRTSMSMHRFAHCHLVFCHHFALAVVAVIQACKWTSFFLSLLWFHYHWHHTSMSMQYSADCHPVCCRRFGFIVVTPKFAYFLFTSTRPHLSVLSPKRGGSAEVERPQVPKMHSSGTIAVDVRCFPRWWFFLPTQIIENDERKEYIDSHNE